VDGSKFGIVCLFVCPWSCSLFHRRWYSNRSLQEFHNSFASFLSAHRMNLYAFCLSRWFVHLNHLFLDALRMFTHFYVSSPHISPTTLYTGDNDCVNAPNPSLAAFCLSESHPYVHLSEECLPYMNMYAAGNFLRHKSSQNSHPSFFYPSSLYHTLGQWPV